MVIIAKSKLIERTVTFLEFWPLNSWVCINLNQRDLQNGRNNKLKIQYFQILKDFNVAMETQWRFLAVCTVWAACKVPYYMKLRVAQPWKGGKNDRIRIGKKSWNLVDETKSHFCTLAHVSDLFSWQPQKCHCFNFKYHNI